MTGRRVAGLVEPSVLVGRALAEEWGLRWWGLRCGLQAVGASGVEWTCTRPAGHEGSHASHVCDDLVAAWWPADVGPGPGRWGSVAADSETKGGV